MAAIIAAFSAVMIATPVLAQNMTAAGGEEYEEDEDNDREEGDNQ